MWSLVINVILTLGKGIIGFVARSDALVADAAHSATDVAGSIAVLVGIHFARRPADEVHPYGHGKAEFIAASLVAILLVLAGIDVMYKSIMEMFTKLVAPASIALYAALVAVVIKEVLYQYQVQAGKKNHSPALIAGAADHRSDVYSSLAAAVGIVIALIGVRLNQPWLYVADPIAGFIVAILVVFVGYRLLRDSFTSLMDEVLDNETTQLIADTVSCVPGVQRIDDLRVRINGSYWIVDVKISVNPEITVLQGHQITKNVKAAIMEKHHEVYDILIHVNPFFAD